MPIYEYKCPQCTKEIEKIRKIAEREDPLECPECGSDMSVKVSDISGYRINWIPTDQL